MFSAYADDEAIHAFYTLPEYVQLKKQLDDGLIHPVEFSNAVLRLAYERGIVS